MPIETILPDATITPHPTWTSNPHIPLQDQSSNFATCAGSNVGNAFTISFGNLTSDVSAGINSITFKVAGLVGVTRGVIGVCNFDLLNSSNSSYGYAEDKSFNDTTLSTLQAGTTRTTSDGSTAWTESDVNGLRMTIKFSSIANSAGSMNLDFLKIDVDYIENVLAPYDNTLNNITMNLGTTVISGGTIIIN